MPIVVKSGGAGLVGDYALGGYLAGRNKRRDQLEAYALKIAQMQQQMAIAEMENQARLRGQNLGAEGRAQDRLQRGEFADERNQLGWARLEQQKRQAEEAREAEIDNGLLQGIRSGKLTISKEAWEENSVVIPRALDRLARSGRFSPGSQQEEARAELLRQYRANLRTAVPNVTPQMTKEQLLDANVLPLPNGALLFKQPNGNWMHVPPNANAAPGQIENYPGIGFIQRDAKGMAHVLKQEQPTKPEAQITPEQRQRHFETWTRGAGEWFSRRDAARERFRKTVKQEVANGELTKSAPGWFGRMTTRPYNQEEIEAEVEKRISQAYPKNPWGDDFEAFLQQGAKPPDQAQLPGGPAAGLAPPAGLPTIGGPGFPGQFQGGMGPSTAPSLETTPPGATAPAAPATPPPPGDSAGGSANSGIDPGFSRTIPDVGDNMLRSVADVGDSSFYKGGEMASPQQPAPPAPTAPAAKPFTVSTTETVPPPAVPPVPPPAPLEVPQIKSAATDEDITAHVNKIKAQHGGTVPLEVMNHPNYQEAIALYNRLYPAGNAAVSPPAPQPPPAPQQPKQSLEQWNAGWEAKINAAKIREDLSFNDRVKLIATLRNQMEQEAVSPLLNAQPKPPLAPAGGGTPAVVPVTPAPSTAGGRYGSPTGKWVWDGKQWVPR